MSVLNEIRERIEGHVNGRKQWGKRYGKLGELKSVRRLLDDLVYLYDNGFLELDNVDKAELTKANRQTAAAKAQNAKLTKANQELRDRLESCVERLDEVNFRLDSLEK